MSVPIKAVLYQHFKSFLEEVLDTICPRKANVSPLFQLEAAMGSFWL